MIFRSDAPSRAGGRVAAGATIRDMPSRPSRGTAASAALPLAVGVVLLVGGLVAGVARQGAGPAQTARPAAATSSQPSASSTQPTSATITINNVRTGFQPKNVSIARGGTLTVENNDTINTHSVTSVAVGGDGSPLFNVKIPPGKTKDIPVSNLGDGVYDFYCRFHPQMTGTLTIGAGGPVVTKPKFEQPLVQPPRLHGKHLRIVMRKAKVRVLPHGPRTPMWTYNGTYPGPTIVRRTGRDTKVTFVNHLPRRFGSMTVHQHAGHQRARYDGQPASHLIRHGHSLTYDFPLRDAGTPLPAALRFYHDHRMMVTARNNWRGLQGMFQTTDPHDARIGLPHGRFDIPLALTDRSFTQDNRLTNPFKMHSGMSGAPMGTVGDLVLVNGRFAPYQRVKPGRYRLQILNSSLFSSYDLTLSNGDPLVQIGTGSGLLPHPVTRQDIFLGPAQRTDVVVDFRHLAGKNVLLSSIPRSDGSTTGVGSRAMALMQFRVRGSTDQKATVPSTLTHIRRLSLPKGIAKTWKFGKNTDGKGTFWSINGKRYDPSRVDHRVRLGRTEKWKLVNTSNTTHFVHLHEELWQTVRRDGKRPPPWERGYEDTWRLDPGETVVVAARFTDYTGNFLVHCHMLDHEDESMMATFRVVR
jgi:FtsP/CotA-like multicopper oxidase with cupredoxin domain/plastocyanin